MNGMVADSWPYVIAAYGVTWVVLVGYAFRLVLMTRRNRIEHSQTRQPT